MSTTTRTWIIGLGAGLVSVLALLGPAAAAALALPAAVLPMVGYALPPSDAASATGESTTATVVTIVVGVIVVALVVAVGLYLDRGGRAQLRAIDGGAQAAAGSAGDEEHKRRAA
jgi:hypothetical protein